MIQFHAPDIETTLTLPESDSAHAIRVLRLVEGDTIAVTDGNGNRFKCRITQAHQKKTRVEIVGREEIPNFWPAKITVAVAPTKNIDRMEWLVEKLTEIGFDSFAPIKCEHSERKEIKTERLDKIAVSAMKQSLKAVMPEIREMCTLETFIHDDCSEQKFIAVCIDGIERKLLSKEYEPGKSVSVLIGPEGDFSPSEIEKALSAGYRPVSLGAARLRTETAALAACQTFHVVNQLSDK